MSSCTYRFEEGVPAKPARIASDPDANLEWNRISDALSEARANSPAWGSIIELTASSYSKFVQLGFEMARYGRTKELAIAQAADLALYLQCCAQCGVSPNPLVRLRRAQARTA
jgi:hypothetical protein